MIRRALILATLLVVPPLLTVPGTARAQTAQIDGNPLVVYADGLGTLQFRFQGQEQGVFYGPDTDVASAGLELRTADAYYPLGSGRNGTSPTLQIVGPGTRALHSTYTVGDVLEVIEDVTYTEGTQDVRLRYVIRNVSDTPIDFAAGELADLYVAGRDDGAGVHQAGPPEFVGGRSANGALTGLVESTLWTHFQAGYYNDVFSNFENGALNDQVDPTETDNGAGAEWVFDDIAVGDTRTIDVTWRVGDTTAPPVVTPTPTPDSTPVPQPAPPPAPPAPPVPTQLPPPVAGKTINAATKSGRVLIKLLGTNAFVELGPGQQIPVGTTLDATKGRVTLTSAADAKGATQTADFYDGIFKLTQTKGAKPVTVLALVEKLSCTAQRSGASASQAKKKTRKLWGDGKGAFRTSGKYSSATVRGTVWLTQDRCDRTLTKVKQGTVQVRDLVKRKTVTVKAGRQYLARAKRR